jgi:hypothetical protein
MKCLNEMLYPTAIVKKVQLIEYYGFVAESAGNGNASVFSRVFREALIYSVKPLLRAQRGNLAL